MAGHIRRGRDRFGAWAARARTPPKAGIAARGCERPRRRPGWSMPQPPGRSPAAGRCTATRCRKQVLKPSPARRCYHQPSQQHRRRRRRPIEHARRRRWAVAPDWWAARAARAAATWAAQRRRSVRTSRQTRWRERSSIARRVEGWEGIDMASVGLNGWGSGTGPTPREAYATPTPPGVPSGSVSRRVASAS